MNHRYRRKKRFGIVSFFVVTSLLLCVRLLIFNRYIFSHQSLEPVARSKHDDDDDDHESPCPAFCTFRTPCLDKLTPNEKTKTSTDGDGRKLPNANYLQQPESIQEINRIPGSLDPVHYHIVPAISAVQWHNGIYGSVAEFGVGVGKFTSLLARTVDTDAGERLFVVDDFSRPLDGQLSMRGRLTQYDLFAANLRRVGFDETATGPQRMLVHRGTAENFQFVRLQEWRLPLFRLISVDFRAMNVTLTRSPVLDLAVCLLTDGGILVVGGVDELQGGVSSVLTTFLSKSEGKPELSPVFVAGDKLFIADSRWSQSLRGHVIEAAENLHLRVTEDDDGFDFAAKLLRIKY